MKKPYKWQKYKYDPLIEAIKAQEWHVEPLMIITMGVRGAAEEELWSLKKAGVNRALFVNILGHALRAMTLNVKLLHPLHGVDTTLD